jgi:hypothetical protein
MEGIRLSRMTAAAGTRGYNKALKYLITYAFILNGIGI